CISPEEVNEEDMEKILETVIKRGHHSVLEHASFTFLIDGISRVTSHQLVRHRIASYSQQSQRYVPLNNPSVVIPASIKENEEALKIFNNAVEKAWEAYRKLVSLGIHPEDARYILPQATKTSIVVTMNARELYHFLSLRLCYRAQREIRDLAIKIFREVMSVAPKLFKYVGPRCKILGYCPEEYKECPLYKNIIKGIRTEL
ncbi:MAG TPA: FAD-dependent thymidylate synthase, partial [Euryarchaeota archaeon]|nr:FAD-dependent thymidylate synthase [Euryarchaeota archaeon]